MSYYESDEQLGQYMAFHYGDTEYFGVPNYPVACVERCLARHGERPRRRALDLGCAVGRSTLELARSFDDVVGIDLSRRFIDSAEQLRRTGAFSYWVRDEGDLGREQRVTLAALDLSDAARRTRFEVGDAQAPGPSHTGYDLVFAGNLLDRLPRPADFLEHVHERLLPGGVLVLTSPYTLLPDFTPRGEWIGGYEDNGQAVTVRDGLSHHLSRRFRPLGEPEDVPFVIRETRRKFQHTVAELTAWECC
ncbi:putative 4-mercaptohistidine N1-methyltransferase [Tamilnaduibacter salinus]|uniref:Putative 4-mercaptohistidine N1-methyltransferase n=1 Tax=Tamilnaduibacter salinus TaxID=1484056 RepID=A0A2U1CWY2_9GAMM|nr:putative 4-mercaptohistidine N1-methyltransferase [Tamilnaduibacter salinus]PVY76490.1 putative 4-mercaptohistidine N1-methyltransferase [Tamilnaduibacter salinus]